MVKYNLTILGVVRTDANTGPRRREVQHVPLSAKRKQDRR